MKRLINLLTAPWRGLKALWLVITAPFRWSRGGWQRVQRFFTQVEEDKPLTDTLGDSLGDRDAFMVLLEGFGEHLDALRQHLLRSVIVLVITTGLSFTFARQIMELLAVPAGGLVALQSIEPTETIGVFMRVSLLSGVVLAMPWMVSEVYLFIAPGLMPSSRVRLLIAIPLASLLFLAGVVYTFYVMLPTAIPFLQDFMGIKTQWRPAAYFGLITSLMFWVGLAFQMPLIIYTLAMVGWLKTKQLIDQWRIAIIVIAIIAAVITPTTDPVNMGLVMLPMVLLYFISIVGAWFAERGLQQRKATAP